MTCSLVVQRGVISFPGTSPVEAVETDIEAVLVILEIGQSDCFQCGGL